MRNDTRRATHDTGRKKGNMLIPTIVMAVLAVTMLVIGQLKGGGQNAQGLKWAGTTLLEITPLLFFAFIVAGMVQVLIPQEVIAKWVGERSLVEDRCVNHDDTTFFVGDNDERTND